MKVPPQATDLEQAILGAIMLASDSLGKVISELEPKHFYEPKHEIIYQAILDLNYENKPIDILTVKAKLEEKNQLEKAGGVLGVAELTSKVSGSANIAFHSKIVIQCYVQRELITICHNVSDRCYKKEDVFKVSDEMLTSIDGLLNFVSSGEPRLAFEVLEDVIKDREENKGKGLNLGLAEFDELTNGLKQGDLMILAARPAMGKTALSVQIAKNVANDNKQCLFFSLEMSDAQLIKRVESQESGLNSKNIDKGKFYNGEEEMLTEAHKRIRKMGIHIDDTPANSVSKMRLKAKRVKNKYGLDLVVVDYLQLARGEGKGNREQEISEISRGLKVLAKELKVPVIGLSQLSRAVEQRQDKRPLLSDLRESGAIEQDADIVAFLYREKYYNENVTDDITELIVRKHRAGELGTINFEFDGKTTCFKPTEKTIAPTKKEQLSPFGLTPRKDVDKDYTPF